MSRRSFVDHERIENEIEIEKNRSDVVFLFNQNPRKNIGKLCQFYKVKEDPRGIAHLMHVVPGLLGSKIGDYLSRDGNQDILKSYFDEADLRVSFIDAMRVALSGKMFLPGEAQLIDRVVETFAKSYCDQNPGVFPDSNVPYTLAFALIMLNSDQHNPNMSRHMSVTQFISNFSGCLPENVVPKEQLTIYYNSIKEEAFSFNGDNSSQFMAMTAPRIRGFLKRKEKLFWNKYYFVLTNSCLYYFRDDTPESEQVPIGNIQLVGVEVSEIPRKRQILLKAISQPIQSVRFTPRPTLETNTYQILLSAPDDPSAAKWFKWIKKSAIFSFFNNPDEAPNFSHNSNDVNIKKTMSLMTFPTPEVGMTIPAKSTSASRSSVDTSAMKINILPPSIGQSNLSHSDAPHPKSDDDQPHEDNTKKSEDDQPQEDNTKKSEDDQATTNIEKKSEDDQVDTNLDQTDKSNDEKKSEDDQTEVKIEKNSEDSQTNIYIDQKDEADQTNSNNERKSDEDPEQIDPSYKEKKSDEDHEHSKHENKTKEEKKHRHHGKKDEKKEKKHKKKSVSELNDTEFPNDTHPKKHSRRKMQSLQSVGIEGQDLLAGIPKVKSENEINEFLVLGQNFPVVSEPQPQEV